MPTAQRMFRCPIVATQGWTAGNVSPVINLICRVLCLVYTHPSRMAMHESEKSIWLKIWEVKYLRYLLYFHHSTGVCLYNQPQNHPKSYNRTKNYMFKHQITRVRQHICHVVCRLGDNTPVTRATFATTSRNLPVCYYIYKEKLIITFILTLINVKLH